jgi:aminoglycoside phosphotransferase (APT) family kinase protein
MSLKNKQKELGAYLAKLFGAKGDVEFRGEKRITMGQSRAMYILDLAYQAGPGHVEANAEAQSVGIDHAYPHGEMVERRVVIRIEQWGHLGSDSRNEVATMRALYSVGFPVARVLAYETSEELLGQPFFLMDFVKGTSVFVNDGSVDDYIRRLHEFHRIDHGGKAFDYLERPKSLDDIARNQVERWYKVYREHIVGEPSPLVAECVQWLRNRAPRSDEITLVHGDPGPGNYMHQDGKITALVDWEFTSLGDPYDDWSYVIWMRGAPYLPEEEWISRIERITGRKLDRERLQYWKAVNILKGVCLDQTSHKLYASQVSSAPNMLAIATAVHLDVLKVLCQCTVEKTASA